LLDDISARLEIVSKLHKSLPQPIGANGVNLGEFLREISAMIGTLAPYGRMNITLGGCSDACIDAREALHAGLVTAELLTNAGKFAHPSGLPVQIHIRCETNDDHSFVVEVTDDGIGFPETFDPATDGGLGFHLMRALANGLGAELLFECDGIGVCGRLVRPRYMAAIDGNPGATLLSEATNARN